MKSITVGNLEKPETYRAFLDFVFRHAAFCSLVVRHGISLQDDSRKFFEITKQDLKTTTNVNEWPGTKLFGQNASVYTYGHF
jgi:hypothetical protein